MRQQKYGFGSSNANSMSCGGLEFDQCNYNSLQTRSENPHYIDNFQKASWPYRMECMHTFSFGPACYCVCMELMQYQTWKYDANSEKCNSCQCHLMCGTRGSNQCWSVLKTQSVLNVIVMKRIEKLFKVCCKLIHGILATPLLFEKNAKAFNS